jgi:hypothetical protein
MASAQTDAIPPQDRKHTAGGRGVFLASLIGSLMLLIFCARELPAWVDREWPELSETAKSIDDVLGGLAAPYDALHGFKQRFSDKKLGG